MTLPYAKTTRGFLSYRRLRAGVSRLPPAKCCDLDPELPLPQVPGSCPPRRPESDARPRRVCRCRLDMAADVWRQQSTTAAMRCHFSPWRVSSWQSAKTASSSSPHCQNLAKPDPSSWLSSMSFLSWSSVVRFSPVPGVGARSGSNLTCLRLCPPRPDPFFPAFTASTVSLHSRCPSVLSLALTARAFPRRGHRPGPEVGIGPFHVTLAHLQSQHASHRGDLHRLGNLLVKQALVLDDSELPLHDARSLDD